MTCLEAIFPRSLSNSNSTTDPGYVQYATLCSFRGGHRPPLTISQSVLCAALPKKNGFHHHPKIDVHPFSLSRLVSPNQHRLNFGRRAQKLSRASKGPRIGTFAPAIAAAQARFGPPLRVAGVQHPLPELGCSVSGGKSDVALSARIAQPVLDGRPLVLKVPSTRGWSRVRWFHGCR